MSILKEGKPVGLACDHAGYEMKQIVMRELDVRGIAYKAVSYTHLTLPTNSRV